MYRQRSLSPTVSLGGSSMFADWVWETAAWVGGGCVLAVTAALMVYFGRKARADDKGEPSGSELLTKFREMHARGVLSDAEFRTIKTSLETRLADELKDTGETGCDE